MFNELQHFEELIRGIAHLVEMNWSFFSECFFSHNNKNIAIMILSVIMNLLCRGVCGVTGNCTVYPHRTSLKNVNLLNIQ